MSRPTVQNRVKAYNSNHIHDISELRIPDIFHRSQRHVTGISSNHHLHYSEIKIPKRDGGQRSISIPSPEILELQRCLLTFLYKGTRMHRSCHGGIRSRSVKTCVAPHINKRSVVTFDIADFFPSVKSHMLRNVLSQIGFSQENIDIIMPLISLDGCLPQGAATSPFFANMCLVRIDKKLGAIAKRQKLSYSRYLDDIAISGNDLNGGILGTVNSLVSSSGFSLKNSKTKVMNSGERQVVLNLVVNEKLRPTKEFVRQLEHDIDLCRSNGVSSYAACESITCQKAYGRLNGRVRYLKQFDSPSVNRLLGKLHELK